MRLISSTSVVLAFAVLPRSYPFPGSPAGTRRSSRLPKGLPPSFVTHDELNQRLTMQPGITMLATASDDPGDRAEGEARVRLRSVRPPGFVATFRRGAEWAATREVTIPPPPGRREGD
jgi:hypothetical protein